MNEKLLVTYASKYGATQEIAEKIAEVLRQDGLQADIMPVKGIRDLSTYQAVILGSAVYVGKWQKEAAEFMRNNEKSLSERAVWLFSSGPTGEGKPAELLEGWRLPEELQPVDAMNERRALGAPRIPLRLRGGQRIHEGRLQQDHRHVREARGEGCAGRDQGGAYGVEGFGLYPTDWF